MGGQERTPKDLPSSISARDEKAATTAASRMMDWKGGFLYYPQGS